MRPPTAAALCYHCQRRHRRRRSVDHTRPGDILQDAREAGEDDIEAILAEILNKEAKQTAVSNQPSRQLVLVQSRRPSVNFFHSILWRGGRKTNHALSTLPFARCNAFTIEVAFTPTALAVSPHRPPCRCFCPYSSITALVLVSPHLHPLLCSPWPLDVLICFCFLVVLCSWVSFQVTVTVCDGPPSPRANFTVTSLPTGDMILFGGECFDGQDTKCFNELFR